MPNTDEASRPLPGDDFVQSLARGLDVITSFDAEHQALTLSDVAERTGLTRATARRLLLTLGVLGYVRQQGRLFVLTPQVLRMGTAYLSASQLPAVAQPHLEQLTARIGESSSLAVLDGTEIVYVARAATRHRLMQVTIAVGTRFPAYATSMGRVLLAALDPAERDAVLGQSLLSARTPHTQVDPAALRSRVADVRRDGYALVDQELEIGLVSMAAPVTHGGQVVAAVNFSMSAAAAQPAGTHLPALLATAADISADLALTARSSHAG